MYDVPISVQMEEVMSHSFRPATIRDMELTLLKALQWRLACVTPFSFLQLLLPLTTSCTVPPAASRCTRLLIHSLSGAVKFINILSFFTLSNLRNWTVEIDMMHAETSLLRFDPSVVASSALRCVLLQDHQQQADISFLTRPLHSFMWLKQDKDTTDACFNTMKALYAGLDNQQMQSDQQRSPISVIPFVIGTDDDNVVDRSAVSRRLFDRRSIPPTDAQKDQVVNSHI
jgi:cyclin D7, plant